MSNLASKISAITVKVENLISLHKQLSDENTKLITSNKELTKTIEEQKNVLKNLNEKNKIVTLAKSISKTDINSNELKSKINEYIREIDKCIALLNN